MTWIDQSPEENKEEVVAVAEIAIAWRAVDS